MLASMPMILTPLKESTPICGQNQELPGQNTGADASHNETAGALESSATEFSCIGQQEEPNETNLPITSPGFADPEISSSVAENALVSDEIEAHKPPQEEGTEDCSPQLTGNKNLSKDKDDGKELVENTAIPSTSNLRSANPPKKKSKRIRDVLNNLKLTTPGSEGVSSKKAFGFAQAYFAKVSERLKGRDDELYQEFLQTMHNFGQSILTVPELYMRISNLFHRHPDLAREFLAFLLPEQAAECGKFMEHLTLTRMRNFIRMLEIHFANQPQQIRKVCSCLAVLSNQSNITVQHIRSSVIPLLRGNTRLIDTFMELLPIEPPPNSIISEPEGLRYRNVSNRRPVDDEFEDVEVPGESDMYGGDHCVCGCHKSGGNNFQNPGVHCKSCGIKFLHGKVFMQAGRAFRPVKVSFGEDPSNSRRRLASEEHPRKSNQKRTADIHEKNVNKKFRKNGNASTKSCKMLKSKTLNNKIICQEGKKCVETPEASNPGPSEGCVEINSPSTVISHSSVGENKKCVETPEAASHPGPSERCIELNSPSTVISHSSVGENEREQTLTNVSESSEHSQESSSEKNHIETDISQKCDKNIEETALSQNSSLDQDMEVPTEDNLEKSCGGSKVHHSSQKTSSGLWTKDEDKIILQMFQADLNIEEALHRITQHLPERSLDEIQERFDTLMQLLRRMTAMKMDSSLTK